MRRSRDLVNNKNTQNTGADRSYIDIKLDNKKDNIAERMYR